MSFTSWFPGRRRLLAELERVHTASIAAQDRVRLLEYDNKRLQDERNAAQADALHSRALVADWLAQRLFGERIYTAAPALPEQAPDMEMLSKIARSRPSARQIVKDGAAKFYAELTAKQVAEATPIDN